MMVLASTLLALSLSLSFLFGQNQSRFRKWIGDINDFGSNFIPDTLFPSSPPSVCRYHQTSSVLYHLPLSSDDCSHFKSKNMKWNNHRYVEFHSYIYSFLDNFLSLSFTIFLAAFHETDIFLGVFCLSRLKRQQKACEALKFPINTLAFNK